jgi:hypothetical protein
VRLSTGSAMVVIVGWLWFVMRASQAAQPKSLLIASASGHGSLEASGPQSRNPLPLASIDITYHTLHTATPPLDSILREKSYTSYPLSQEPLRPRGQRQPPPCLNSLEGYIILPEARPSQKKLSNIPFTRPVSPTLAHGTSSTPAPTRALSVASPPPSP